MCLYKFFVVITYDFAHIRSKSNYSESSFAPTLPILIILEFWQLTTRDSHIVRGSIAIGHASCMVVITASTTVVPQQISYELRRHDQISGY